MSNEYGVGYIEQWQGYEVPNNKTVQELEAEMQLALANAASAGIDADGNVYVDSNGNLILPSRSIIGYLHIRDATIDSANIAVAAIGTAHIQRASITTALIADGSIIDAKIVDLTATKITAGEIDTGEVFLTGPGGKLRITGNRVQVFDKSAVPKERVSMGDVWGDGTVYGFLMRAADGQTVMMDWSGVKSAGITDGAITNPKISDGAVKNNNIYANTITGDKLVINAITSREIMSGAVTANMITTGTLTGVNISGVTITGSTIDGGVFRSSDWGTSFTVTAGQMRLANTSNGSYVNTTPQGVTGYDAYNAKFYALSSTFVETEAVRTTNKNVYLVTKYGASSYGEVRCVLDIGVPGNGGVDDYSYANLRAANIYSNGQSVITTGNISNYIPANTGVSQNYVDGRFNDLVNQYYMRKYLIDSPSSSLVGMANNGAKWELGNDGSNFFQSTTAADRPYTGTGLCHITNSGTFGRIGSSRRFKLNIEDLKEDRVHDILNLRPRTWHDKGVVEEAARYLNQVTPFDQEGNDADFVAKPKLPNDIRAIERIVGFVAEEVDEIGLNEYVVYGPYDEEGNRQIESVMYDRMWIPLIPIIRELVEKVRILEENAS